jgi:hypothetical protein
MDHIGIDIHEKESLPRWREAFLGAPGAGRFA